MKSRESDLMRRSWLDRNPWVAEMWELLYEFRIPIITVILLIMLFAFHSCEIRVSIDSRPSPQATEQQAGPK